MSRKARLPQSPHHVMIYDEDWEFLRATLGPGGLHKELGIGEFVRELVHRRVAELRQRMTNAVDSLAPPSQQGDQ